MSEYRGTDGFAIASLVTGLLGMNLIAVIFGHVSLGRIKREPGLEGRGLAIAGLILGYLGLVILFLVVVFVLGLAAVFASAAA